MNEFRAKTFKSGNSVALRLPRDLGVAEGEELVVVPHANETFTLYRRSDAAAVLRSLYGSMSPGFMSGGRGDIEQVDRNWDVTPAPGKAA